MQGVMAGWQAALAQPAAEGADGTRIAEMALVTWRAIDLALSPIIGKGGFAALYKRSLHLTCQEFPWLEVTPAASLHPDGLARLQASLSLQPGIDAAAANSCLLRHFSDLLTSLLGATLAERLLQAAWEDLSAGNTGQDNS
jgi:hypothetical protein